MPEGSFAVVSDFVGAVPGAAKEGAIAIRQGLATIFGPAAGEFGQYLADKVRFHRYRSLEKILAKAVGPGGRPPKIPPFKFLVPFFEQASLEEDDDDVIIDIWAKLLADAAREFSSRHMIFLRLVKEITSQEAQLLNDLCHRYRGGFEGPGVWSAAEAPGAITEAGIYNFLMDWIDNPSTDSKRPFAAQLIEKFEKPGVLIRSVSYYKGTRGAWPYDHADNDATSDLASPLERAYPHISFDILRGLNIIQEGTTDEVWHKGFMASVSFYELTPLGVEFFTLCNGSDRVKPPQGNSWSPETGWQWR
jgi:hypothetical protein